VNLRYQLHAGRKHPAAPDPIGRCADRAFPSTPLSTPCRCQDLQIDVLTEGIGYQQDGEPGERSNRPLLQWLVDNAAAEDLEIKAAIEIEWAVSAGDGDDFVSAAVGPAHGMAWLVGVSDYVRDVLDALTAEG
jgi:hypothetical protein